MKFKLSPLAPSSYTHAVITQGTNESDNVSFLILIVILFMTLLILNHNILYLQEIF
ncbi:MAG: hypothetical protein [Caudoviricetes sp.]|nr:MAG: hypothetical protein [Caudoviricetes sp.]